MISTKLLMKRTSQFQMYLKCLSIKLHKGQHIQSVYSVHNYLAYLKKVFVSPTLKSNSCPHYVLQDHKNIHLTNL